MWRNPKALHVFERLAVLDRHHLHEFRKVILPIFEDGLRPFGARVMAVIFDKPEEPQLVVLRHVVKEIDEIEPLQRVAVRLVEGRDIAGIDRLQFHHRHVAMPFEIAALVEHIGDAARHAGREVAPRRPEHHDATARHIFAAVIAGAFDNGDGARIAHGEPLASHAAEIALAGNRTVKHGIADDDAFLGHDGGAIPEAER